MTNKELILECLLYDDEAFTQILEYFVLAAEVEISSLELKKMLNEMVEEGYIFINYSWKTERDEYPYSLTEKGRMAWNNLQEKKIEKVISLLDPIGVIGLGPLDEYKDIARKVYELLIKKEYQQLKQYLVDQYPTKEEVNFRKVDITIEILINILE
jgi:DNA-binding MarR family transcriptional regulator